MSVRGLQNLALTRRLLRNSHHTLTKGLCLGFDAELYALVFSSIK